MSTPAPPSDARYLLPREIADRYGVGLDKVLGWIRAGELRAINLAARQGGQPRWRISPGDLALFEQARSSQPPPPRAARARRAQTPVVEEYYK